MPRKAIYIAAIVALTMACLPRASADGADGVWQINYLTLALIRLVMKIPPFATDTYRE